MTTSAHHRLLIVLLFVGLTFICVISGFYQWVIRADYFIFDQQSRYLLSEKPANRQIVVIALDDHSLTAMKNVAGRWVWPRSVHAELIEGLQAHKPKQIAFDILFSERDIYRPDADNYFNEVINQYDNIYFSMLALNGDQQQGFQLSTLKDHLPLYDNIPQAKQAKQAEPSNALQRALFLLPHAIASENWQLGTINFQAELDGVGRYYDIYRAYGDWKILSLAAALAKKHSELPQQKNMLLNWRGAMPMPYHTVSYADVYQAIINEDDKFLQQFTDKIVFIGATAAGLYDARNTPVAQNLPGVYMLATALDNLLSDNVYQETPAYIAVLLSLVNLLMIALCFYVLKSYANQLTSSFLLMLFSSTLLMITSLELMKTDQVLFIGSSLLMMLLAWLVYALTFGYQEYVNKQKALTMFGRFLDPHVVYQLLAQGKLDAEYLNQRKCLTVLFSDIRGFTQLSEQQDAKEVLSLLNEYFNQQVAVIFSTKGTLDKFIGDCIMAFWGAPIASDHHAADAIEAALLMEENLLAFKRTLPEHLQGFDIGIGVHTGEVIAGLVGTEQRVDYTVIGDAVNLASRIESLTKNTSRILVSEQTKNLADTLYNFEYQGEFNVKGRVASVKLFQPRRK